MFYSSKFNGDVSKWDVSKVTNMQSMFGSHHSSWPSINGDLGKWDVSKVTDMKCMFCESKFNGDVSKWDVSKVTDMESMFEDSGFNGDLSEWNVWKVDKHGRMFVGSNCSLCDHVPYKFGTQCRNECIGHPHGLPEFAFTTVYKHA